MSSRRTGAGRASLAGRARVFLSSTSAWPELDGKLVFEAGAGACAQGSGQFTLLLENASLRAISPGCWRGIGGHGYWLVRLPSLRGEAGANAGGMRFTCSWRSHAD